MSLIEENFSSCSLAFTFIGFQTKVVIPFLREAKKFGADHVVLLTAPSKDPENLSKNEVVMKEALKFIHENWVGLSHTIKNINDLWNLSEYFGYLKSLKPKDAIVNVSSGPGAYTSAATVYAVIFGYAISHSVESDKSVFFHTIRLKPVTSLMFNLNRTDQMIVEAVANGCGTVEKIAEKMNEMYFQKITERAIHYRVDELNRLGILFVSRGRPKSIAISGDLSELGF
ncbi:MAG: hypothetical protein M1476_02290 [Candidatus Thermoplasmatota archaeon]|nr:hypothetical protein [Candidatus Thermoplasmatota archaeon]